MSERTGRRTPFPSGEFRKRIVNWSVGRVRAWAGPALERQLRPIADDLTGHLIGNCGHIIPQHRPDVLLTLLEPFLAG